MVPFRRILPGCVGHAPIAFARSVFSVAAPSPKRSPASAQAARVSIDCRIRQYGGRKVVRRVHGMLRLRASPRFPPGGLGGVCVTRAPQSCKPRVETSGQVVLLTPYSRTDITTTRQTRRRPIRDPPVSTGGFLRWRLHYACLLPMQAASGNERTGSATDTALADCLLGATQTTRQQADATSTHPRSPGFHRGFPGWCPLDACATLTICGRW